MDVPTGKHKQAQLSPLSFSKKFVSKNYYGVTAQKFTFLHLPQFLFLSCCLVVSSVSESSQISGYPSADLLYEHNKLFFCFISSPSFPEYFPTFQPKLAVTTSRGSVFPCLGAGGSKVTTAGKAFGMLFGY